MRRSLERQRMRDLGSSLDLVADVDLVVPLVRPDPPEAQEPGPETELARLFEVVREPQRAVAHLVVRAFPLGHAVDVDVERRAHLRGERDAGLGHGRHHVSRVRGFTAGAERVKMRAMRTSATTSTAIGAHDGPGRGTIAAAGAGASAAAAVTDALRGLEVEPALVLVFPDAGEDLVAAAPAVTAAAGGAPVAGMASSGALAPTAGAPTSTALALGGAGVTAGMAVTPDARAAPREAAATAVRDAIIAAPATAAADGQRGLLVLLFFDPAIPEHADVVAGAYAAAGPDWPLAGGAAAMPAGRAGLIAGATALEHAVVAVALRTRAPLGVGVAYGWRPVGIPALVTRACGPVVEQLNGRQADEVYLELLGRADVALDDDAFAELASSHPLGQPELSGEVRLRHVFGRTAEGGLRCATPIPPNAAVVLAEQAVDDVIASVPEAVGAATAGLDGPPRAALVFDCASRKHTLGDALADEQAALARELGPGVAIAGAFTHGEVGRSRGAIGDRAHAVVVVAAR